MICRVREGVGEGVSNWFEENIRRVVGDWRDTLFSHDTWLGDVSLRVKFSRLFDLAVEKESSVEDMWRRGWDGDGGRGWRRRLIAWEEESMRERYVLLHKIVLQDIVYDSWRWLLDPVHGYLVRGAYQHITSTGDLVDRTLMEDVWHKQILSKVSILVWRFFRNRIPTKDNLA